MRSFHTFGLSSPVESSTFPMSTSTAPSPRNTRTCWLVRHPCSPRTKPSESLVSGEYIGGALRWEDLILYATEAGFTQPRLVTAKPYIITNEEIQKAAGKTKFVSAIFRCFKLPLTEQDPSQFNIPYQLTYETPLMSAEDEFFFDHSLQFKVSRTTVRRCTLCSLSSSSVNYWSSTILPLRSP